MSNTPHDTFFAQLFGRLDIARDQLPRLVPAKLAARLDWATLRHEPTVTVDQTGHQLRSDLVFSVWGFDGQPVLLFFHLEHQRTAQPLMPLRTHGYGVRIWRGWCELEAHRTGSPPRHLPPIVTIVVYNGTNPWSAPTTLDELIRPREALLLLASHHLRGGFRLLDLSSVSDEQLLASADHAHAQLGMWLLKHIDAPDLWYRLVQWSDTARQIRDMNDAMQRIQEVLRYIASVCGEPDRSSLEEFMQHFSEEERGEALTWVQSIEKKGREVGGARLLAAQLERRFGPLTSAVSERLAAASEAELEAWALRLLDATSLDGVFGDGP